MAVTSLALIVLAGCSEERQKREWGVLEVLEDRHHGTITEGPIFDSFDGYNAVGIRTLNGQEVWVLLDAKTEPYFKKFPMDVNLTIAPKVADFIVSSSKCSKIVREKILSDGRKNEPTQ